MNEKLDNTLDLIGSIINKKDKSSIQNLTINKIIEDQTSTSIYSI